MKNNISLVIRNSGLNQYWMQFNETSQISLRKKPVFDASSKVFTMGSCFAVEIRKALKKQGINPFPLYTDIALDESRYKIGLLPERENLNYYNTFSIEQEFSRALGLWEQDDTDYWAIEDQWWDTGGPVYQCPYRRCVYGKTREDIIEATSHLSNLIREGMEQADVFLITLGLIEVWRKKDNGRIACMEPGYNGGGGEDELEFHLSTYQENLENLRKTIRNIESINPSAQVVVTVSPVPLGRTFTDNDVFIANMESKSLLRAVAGEITRSYENVHYFPSYDICSALGNVYTKDGRHVKKEIIQSITSLFMQAFAKD